MEANCRNIYPKELTKSLLALKFRGSAVYLFGFGRPLGEFPREFIPMGGHVPSWVPSAHDWASFMVVCLVIPHREVPGLVIGFGCDTGKGSCAVGMAEWLRLHGLGRAPLG